MKVGATKVADKIVSAGRDHFLTRGVPADAFAVL